MAESDIATIRPPEPITITVLRARNLRGQKGDNLFVTIRVEFGEKVLGDTPKLECSPDYPAEFNFNTTLQCSYDDPYVLDEIAHKPVVFTVTEVLPKEKRQKEEKVINLGQCTVDLLPLITGETKHQYTIVVQPNPGSPLEQIPLENPKPEVDVVISVNEPLLDAQQLKEGNLMTLTMESLFSPPGTWVLSGHQYYYAAALPLPVSVEKETLIVFPNGLLRPGAEKELVNRQKKWTVPGSAMGAAVYIPDNFIASDPIENEDGELKSKEDRDFRAYAEAEKNRVTWNSERRYYLDATSVKSLQESIARNRLWPVEIMRLPQSSAGPKGGAPKKGKAKRASIIDEDGPITYHGLAFVDFAPLLYPGVKRIHGAYKVHPYMDHTLFEKCKRRTGIADEAAKIAVNIINRNTTSPSPKKGGAKEADKKEAKKAQQALSTKAEPMTDSESLQPPVNIEGQMYAEANTYIMLEICLSQPLVPKRLPEELSKRVADYIPPRPLYPKRTDGAQKAVEDYHYQIASIANLILEEFREKFGEELKEQTDSSDSMETRRQKLLYELNSSGKYFAFKEQLKHAVVKIVREKYLKTTNFNDRQELQTFLSELYVYLVDQMHVSLGKVLSIEDQPPIPVPLTTSLQLKHFAQEAEINENYELAAKYYLERIARDSSSADHWVDYGIFCLSINDVTKAEECFKECVSINQKHLLGLLLCGVVCTMSERSEAAETFFEAATCIDPKSVLAWTLLGLFYTAVNNEIRAEMAYLEAEKLSLAQAVVACKMARLEECERERRGKIHKDTTEDTDAVGTLEGGLSMLHADSNKGNEKTGPHSARSFQGNKTTEKRSSVSGKKPASAGLPVAVAKKGDGSSRPSSQIKTAATGEEHEDSPPTEPVPVSVPSIYMQTVEWLLQVHAVSFTERALAQELLHPGGGPTAQYQIALAKLHLQKKQFEDAEEYLTEALQVEYQNGDAWALLGHIKYLTGQLEASRNCYERTISFVNEASEMHTIYLRLASIYLGYKQYQDAKEKFLLACKHMPSCVSWLGVGIACYRLDELLEAEDALSEANILNNSDPEVWGYLSLVCLKTGRQLEAEQAYRYSVQLHLQDTELLEEIHDLQLRVGFGDPQF